MKKFLLLGVVIFIAIFYVANLVGGDKCKKLAEYVGLDYRYGLSEVINTGSSCSLYHDYRWISANTYYEYNNISYMEALDK